MMHGGQHELLLRGQVATPYDNRRLALVFVWRGSSVKKGESAKHPKTPRNRFLVD